jgi:hypothetical protein
MTSINLYLPFLFIFCLNQRSKAAFISWFKSKSGRGQVEPIKHNKWWPVNLNRKMLEKQNSVAKPIKMLSLGRLLHCPLRTISYKKRVRLRFVWVEMIRTTTILPLFNHSADAVIRSYFQWIQTHVMKEQVGPKISCSRRPTGRLLPTLGMETNTFWSMSQTWTVINRFIKRLLERLALGDYVCCESGSGRLRWHLDMWSPCWSERYPGPSRLYVWETTTWSEVNTHTEVMCSTFPSQWEHTAYEQHSRCEQVFVAL